MTSFEELKDRLEGYEARTCIMGLGYVGLPVALSFAEAGFPVDGLDIKEKRIQTLNQGKSPIPDIDDDRVRKANDSGLIRYSTDSSVIAESDVVLICVPTPLGHSRDPDVSYIISAVDSVIEHIKGATLVILESTTYPGTTQELVAPRFRESGLKLDRDVFLAFSPERIDPGNPTYRFVNTPKVVGGYSKPGHELAVLCYERVIDKVVPVSNARTAEIVKLLENTFRSVNIGLANEMALLCDRIGVDIWEVVEAASTKPYGFMPFYPGPGLGGHCIPVDPLFLSWKARTLNTTSRFIELADEINRNMPRIVVEKIFSALNSVGRPIANSEIVLFGVSYKANVDDTRESPAEEIVRLLRHHDGNVRYCDPYVREFSVDGEEVTRLLDENVGTMDAAVVVTAHEPFEWENLLRGARCVVDTRGVITENNYSSGALVRL